MLEKNEIIKTRLLTALVAVGVVALGVVVALVVFPASGDGTNMAPAIRCARDPCSNTWSGDIDGGAIGMGPYGLNNWVTRPSVGGLPPNVPLSAVIV